MLHITYKVLDIHKIIAAFIETLQEDIYVLMRIEFLMALVTAMFLVIFVLGIFQFRYRWSSMQTIISTLDGVSDHIVIYILGAMGSADFEKQVFPVWALVLVSLRGSLGYLSGYSLLDREQRVAEISNVLKFVGSGFLNATRGLGFTRPLWSLWAIMQLRGFYRSFAHHGATKSLWLGRSSEFLPEYLRKQHVNQQKYLVYGETKQKIDIERPQYVLQLEITDYDSLITLDKIKSKCSEDSALRSIDRCKYKDISLAFYLSRLLRCRLEDAALHSDSIASTRQLIITEIGAERMFNILELELAFVRDYFHSLYPVIFWKGLRSLSFSMVQSIATFAVAFWLAVDIGNLYKSTKEEDVVLLLGSMNVDVIATWVFLFFMLSKEVWEILTYLLSNWTRLLLVCKYARSQYWVLGIPGITNDVTSSLFTSNIVDPWHRRIDQYEFFKSCTYKPTFWKFVHSATLGKTPEKLDGRESGDAIRIKECVLKAVQQELHRCLLDPTSQKDYKNIPSFGVPENFQRYKWALCKLSKCSQSILVWNIATSLCEVKLAEDKGIDLRKPSFLCCVWSWLQKQVCCSSQQFLLGENVSRLQGSLQSNYCIANSLSRYCGYLLAFRGELLPDSFVVPDVIFETALQQATNENLKECDLTRCKYNAFMALAPQDIEDGILSKDIVQQGAKLAKDLINECEGVRWEILAGVWTKLLVNTAPSWNVEAHKKSIESGGELITLIWALLWHCGIDKSSMWPEDGSTTEITTPAPQTRDPRMFAEEQDDEVEIHISDEAHTDMGRQMSCGNAQPEIDYRGSSANRECTKKYCVSEYIHELA